MSFEIKIRTQCDHVLREELHTFEQDEKTVLLDYGMASTAKTSVKINGINWPRNNKDEVFRTFNISSVFENESKNAFVIPFSPFFKGNNLAELANSASEIILIIEQTEELELQADGTNKVFKLSYNDLVSSFNCFSRASLKDLNVLVSCYEAEIESVDSINGIITLKEAPDFLDRVTVTYWRRIKVESFNGETGQVRTSENIPINSTVFACVIKQEDNGWTLRNNPGALGPQKDIIFDKFKDSDKSQVIGENLSSQIDGRNKTFQTEFRPWKRFESTITTVEDEILFNSFTIFLNEQKILPLNYDPNAGIFTLREAPKIGDELSINYFYDNQKVPDIVEVTYPAVRTACPKCHNLQELYDYKFDKLGQLLPIENEEKLEQDLTKIVLTIRTTNASHQWYGTLVEQLIGQKNLPQVTPGLIGSEVTTAVTTLQSLQNQQGDYQTVTAEELIDRIEGVRLDFDPASPDFVKFTANIITFSRTQRRVQAIMTKYGSIILDENSQKFPTIQNLTQKNKLITQEDSQTINQQ